VSSYRTRPRVEQDLRDHFSNIALDKIAPADRFLRVAEQVFERLAAFPGMGRVWDSHNPRLGGLRVCPMPSPYRKYLVFYQIISDREVEILTVLHASRNVEGLLGEIL
jgi:plasmid stabilization system protein ParE